MKRSGLKLLAQLISKTAILAGSGRLGIPGQQKDKLSIKKRNSGMKSLEACMLKI